MMTIQSDYVERLTCKPEPRLKHLALHLTGVAVATYSALDDVWYLGGGVLAST